jgi:hypothetical protein
LQKYEETQEDLNKTGPLFRTVNMESGIDLNKLKESQETFSTALNENRQELKINITIDESIKGPKNIKIK